MIGGKSRRFGRDKVIEPLEGVMLISRVLGVLERLFPEVLLIGHERKELAGLTIIPDIIPGCGPLGGIYTALASSSNPYCFVFAADMPNLNEGLIRYMASLKEQADIILPRWSPGMEPLHAIYAKGLQIKAKKLIDNKSFKIYSLIEQSAVHEISEDVLNCFGNPASFFANVNTLKDVVDTFGCLT